MYNIFDNLANEMYELVRIFYMNKLKYDTSLNDFFMWNLILISVITFQIFRKNIIYRINIILYIVCWKWGSNPRAFARELKSRSLTTRTFQL